MTVSRRCGRSKVGVAVGDPGRTSAPLLLMLIGRGTRAENAVCGAVRRSRDRPGLGPPDLCQIVRTLKGKHQVR